MSMNLSQPSGLAAIQHPKNGMLVRYDRGTTKAVPNQEFAPPVRDLTDWIGVDL